MICWAAICWGFNVTLLTLLSFGFVSFCTGLVSWLLFEDELVPWLQLATEGILIPEVLAP